MNNTLGRPLWIRLNQCFHQCADLRDGTDALIAQWLRRKRATDGAEQRVVVAAGKLIAKDFASARDFMADWPAATELAEALTALRSAVCRSGDILCPCPDGDPCHYEPTTTTRAMPTCGDASR